MSSSAISPSSHGPATVHSAACSAIAAGPKTVPYVGTGPALQTPPCSFPSRGRRKLPGVFFRWRPGLGALLLVKKSPVERKSVHAILHLLRHSFQNAGLKWMIKKTNFSRLENGKNIASYFPLFLSKQWTYANAFLSQQPTITHSPLMLAHVPSCLGLDHFSGAQLTRVSPIPWGRKKFHSSLTLDQRPTYISFISMPPFLLAMGKYCVVLGIS